MQLNITTLRQIIELLIEKYPNSLPSATVTPDYISRLQGQQDAVKYLIQHLETQERNKK